MKYLLINLIIALLIGILLIYNAKENKFYFKHYYIVVIILFIIYCIVDLIKGDIKI